MESLAAVAPFAKVFGAFFLMLAGMRLKLGLPLSILGGGIVMGLAFGLGPGAMIVTGLSALMGEKFLLLLLIIGLIMMLSDALERSGQSRRLMDALSGYLTNPQLRLVFFPALIGLLPMPGGAIFSAPMVKAIGDEMQLGGEDQAVINYWFRHIWELSWPLYPGLILTAALAGIPITTFIALAWPSTLAMVFFGWLFLLRRRVPVETLEAVLSRKTGRNGKSVLREGTPLLIAIVGAVGCETLLARFAQQIPFEWGVIGALFCSVLAVMIQNRLGISFLVQVLSKKSLWTMLMVVAAVFIFKDLMRAAGVVDEMATGAGGGVALFAAAGLLPFLVGMISGINVAFVGATFPLLLGLLASLGMENQMLPYLVLAAFAGFSGVMISPIHICFVLTCNYFGANVASCWRRMILPVLGVIGTGATIFLFS